jgi:hypothetical protein
MDFLEIILNGYFNENNRKFLDSYFLREFKKAEKEYYYDKDSFFYGCLNVINGFERHLENELHNRKKELLLMLNEAKKGTLKYANNEKDTTQLHKETIEYCNSELSNISKHNFTYNLLSVSNGRIPYSLQFNQMLIIKKAIEDAFCKLNQLTTPNTTKIKKKTGRGKTKIFPLIDLIKEEKKEKFKKIQSDFINTFKDYEAQKLGFLIDIMIGKDFLTKKIEGKTIIFSLFNEFGKNYDDDKYRSVKDYIKTPEKQGSSYDVYFQISSTFLELFNTIKNN